MKQLVLAQFAISAVACVCGWWMFELQSPADEPRDLPVLITAAAASLAIPGLLGSRRRSADPLPFALALAAALVVIGYYRLLEPPTAATVGAAAWYLSAPALFWVLRSRSPATYRLPRWAVWDVPVALTLMLLIVSGPRLAGDSTVTRATTWAVIERQAFDALVVEPQENPLAMLVSNSAAMALWAVWSAWLVSLLLRTVFCRYRDMAQRPLEGEGTTATLLATGLMVVASVVASWPTQLPIGPWEPSPLLDRWFSDLLVMLPAIAALAAGSVAVWEELVTPRLVHPTGGRVRLGSGSSPAALGRRLSEVLGDPSAKVLVPRAGGWVELSGRPTFPGEADDRAATVAIRDGVAVAAIEYDASLSAQPDLVDIAATSAGLAIEQVARSADAHMRAEQLREAATDLLMAAENSRERFRRRLASGPGLRLDTLAARLEDGRVPCEEIHLELRSILEELRQMSHGEVPLCLYERGLAPAIEELSVDTGVRIDIEGPTVDPDTPEIETLYLAISDLACDSSNNLSCELLHQGSEWKLLVSGAHRLPGVHIEERLDALGGHMHLAGTDVVLAVPIPGDDQEAR